MTSGIKLRLETCLLALAICAALAASGCDRKSMNLALGRADTRVTGVTVSGADKVVISADSESITVSPTALDNDVVAIDVKNAMPAEGLPMSVPGAGSITGVEIEDMPYLDPPVVRVKIRTEPGMTYSINHMGGDLEVSFSSSQAFSEEDDEFDDIPYEEAKDELERILSGEPPPPIDAAPYNEAVAGSLPEEQTSSPYPPILADMPPPNMDGSASVLGDVLYRSHEEGMQVLLLTNGYVHDFLDFTLTSPPKIVIDLWGVSPQTSKKVYPLNRSGIKQVRIGPHHDKTRVVIDLRRSASYSVSRTRSGVIVTVYDDALIHQGMSYTTYKTGPSDSLRSVAQKMYGNPDNWPRILSANREIFTRKELRMIDETDGALILGEGISLKVPER